MNLTLTPPAPFSKRTQPFNANANPLYSGQGLKGHTAEDWDLGWDKPVKVLSPKAYCYSVMNKDNADPMKYRAVFTLVQGYNGLSDWAEISYGHANKILAVPGETYYEGETLMTVGNAGTVYAGGRLVTKEEKLAGSRAGHHLHGPQVRPVRRVKKRVSSKKYLTDANGFLKKNGYYFEIVDYGNGWNGCVDPSQFYTSAPKPPKFLRDLYLGARGEDVRQLQKYLNSKGFLVATAGAGSPGSETDYYGPATRTAVAVFQKVNGIYPTEGYFGAKTRAFINSA